MSQEYGLGGGGEARLVVGEGSPIPLEVVDDDPPPSPNEGDDAGYIGA